MNVKLYDSELKVMTILWKEGSMRASRICEISMENYGWNPNTTYTVIKKCIAKGYIKRGVPGFWCEPLISQDEAHREETNNLIQRLYRGSIRRFLTGFVGDEYIVEEDELDYVKGLIDERRKE